jgi:hypothetical protein
MIVVHGIFLWFLGLVVDALIELLEQLLLLALERGDCAKRFDVARAQRAVGGKDFKTLFWGCFDVTPRERRLARDRSRKVADADKERSAN